MIEYPVMSDMIGKTRLEAKQIGFFRP